MNAVNVVWLKRDLRSQDHAPLHAAEQAGLPYFILYLFEPSLIQRPDTSERHLQFIYHSLLQVQDMLPHGGKNMVIAEADAVEFFEYLSKEFEVQQVFSHRESGPEATWKRDKQVSRFLRQNGIKWTEFQRDGILRGIHNREGWDSAWFVTMHEPVVENRYELEVPEAPDHPFPLSDQLRKVLEHYPDRYQLPGERQAWRYLKTFAESRGANYFRHISKPTQSRSSCGRVSPYLAWGNLSIKQAFQFVKAHPHAQQNKRAYNAFLTRLKWHCHFIQKFEVECEYETICINRGYELLERDNTPDFVKAWEQGLTGFPLVDANMRCVAQTGWINFRMRAMVVSILCHHLDQDWRAGVYFLARQFLDYEPGIHYPQFQMQAGTTGVNTVRMYNPVKQSLDHDPEGVFIKKWVPELAPVPKEFIHEPWKMPPLEQEFCGIRIGKDYPLPLVDLEESGKRARQKIWGHRKNLQVREEQLRILRTHTRNKKLKR